MRGRATVAHAARFFKPRHATPPEASVRNDRLAPTPAAQVTTGVHAFLLEFFAAAEPGVWEQLRRVPKQTWINLAICIIALLVVVRLWKALKNFNEFAPYIAASIAGVLIFFYWVYERSEPRFLTPLVEKIAPFFPSRGQQNERIDRVRESR
jgi:hypothetical protein